MPQEKTYTINGRKLGRSCYSGFVLSDDGHLEMDGEREHFLVLNRFNSYERGSRWGILQVQASVPAESIMTIRAFAVDACGMEECLLDRRVSVEEKRSCFERAEGIASINTGDVLLYALRGQYLWVSIEISGAGEGYVSEAVLRTPGDNFMQTFPEIFQDWDGFFHRYLSVFSTLYHDVNQKFAHMERYLDAETAPEWMLPYLADWLGIKLEGGFLETQVMRNLIREAGSLNRMKGTAAVLRRLVEIVLGEQAIIVEYNRISADTDVTCSKLYGESMQDVTVLLNIPPDENRQAKLQFLIKQFKPARSVVKVVCYHNCNKLDSYCYMDRNAILAGAHAGIMDRDTLDTGIVLQ